MIWVFCVQLGKKNYLNDLPNFLDEQFSQAMNSQAYSIRLSNLFVHTTHKHIS